MPPLRLNRLLVLTFGLLTGGVFGLAWLIWRYGRREQARPARAIVVLGARVHPGGVPSAPLRARVEKAVALYRAGIAPRVLFTGGRWRTSPAEARVALELALAEGLPAEACLVEEESRTTAENAANAARLKAAGDEPAVIVSDPFHLLRAQRLFLREGLAVHTSPAWGAWERASRAQRLYWLCREGFAFLARPRLWAAGSGRRP